ncbi:hypothetical protein NDU88_004933 [Pleurodeles waltl]|uniref:Uncharacterized protein n=1 Tax=Pleurodeles waltl TaxID=8319 RepID=A0AAV7NL04_PLEWA|nr:hypothetical protein NDU88_004933 [Pleurodeles waltl]
MLSVQKPPPRPAQYEALSIWDLMAIRQRKQKFERRMKRAEKTLAEARWDNETKMWRRGIDDGLKMFPATTQEDETQGKKATCKTDKGSSKPKETQRSWVDADDSDNEEFLNQLLHDRPPSYAINDNVQSTSVSSEDPAQNKGISNTVKTSDTVLIQNGASVPTAPDTQIQLQPPQIQRLYPDVPVLERTTSLMVPPDPIYTRSKLVQIEPTPQLLPQPQQQVVPSYTSVAGPQSVATAPMMNQAKGVNAPQGLGLGQTPAAISLPITVGPPVPLYAQGKPGICDQGLMTQEAIRGGSTGHLQGGQTVERSRSLLDFSPIEVPLETMRQAGLGTLTPQVMSTNTTQTPMVQSGNISLQGLTVQQLNEWLNKLNTPQTTTVTPERSEREEYLNFVRLGVEAMELVEGTMGVNRLESYTEAGLRYLCPKITKEVSKVHQRLANLVDKYGRDMESTKHLKRSYRLDFEPKDFDHMRSTRMKANLKEILQSAQICGALEKWEGRWAKKRDKEKGDGPEPKQAKSAPDTGTIKMLPMRETAGGVLVHVLWSRGDILSFTNDYPRLREKPIERYQQTDRFVKLAKCLWEDLNTLFEIIVPPDLWLECKRGVDWPTEEPARNKVTGAPSAEVMRYFHKVIEFLKQKVSSKVTNWQKIDRTSQEAKESIHAYYERLLKAFKHYSGTEVIESKDMNHLVFRFVEGLRPEIIQMIKNHLTCWQAKPIDEVLQYAKYCSDGIELKQRKLKEKVMVMQIKAAQAGMQGNGIQQMVQQQPQGNGMFQAQPRGRGRGGFANRGPDMNTVIVQNDVQGMKKVSPCHACGGVGHWKRECPMVVQDGVVQQSNDVGTFKNVRGIEVQTNSDDEGDDGQFPELETEIANEEYPLITPFPMLTVTDLPPELQGTVTEKVWDLTGKEVGLIKGVDLVKVEVKPNALFPQVPQYHMAQDVLIQVAKIIADFVKQGVLKKVLSSPCNSPILGLKKPCGKVRIVQDLRKINKIVVKCCPILPNPAVIMFQVLCDAEWFTVVDLSQAFFLVPLHEDSQFLFSFKFLDKVYSWCRIPQGLSESPSIFNQILKKDLESLELPFSSTLVQYINDLLIASRTKDDCRNDSLTVAKLLLRELIPRFGFPIYLESDRGRHFNNEVIKLLCAALNIEQKLHCSYRPEASGLVEHMKGTLKSRMAKMCAATNLKWPDALPLVLMSMRNTPDKETGLSPHEILMGRAMGLPAVPANALVNITDDMVLEYCKGLADVVHSFSHQVEATTLPPISDPGHTLKAGDWVVVKKHVRKSCLEPHWKGPYQVILTTTTAVKSAGLPNWIHASHTKKVTCPTDEELEVSKTTAAEKEVSGPENIQMGTETEGEPAEDGLVTQTVNEFQKGDGEPISAEVTGNQHKERFSQKQTDTGLRLSP